MLLKAQSKQIPVEFFNKESKYKKYHKIKFKNKIFDISVSTGTFVIINKKNGFYTPRDLNSFLKILKPKIKEVDKKARASLFIKVDVPRTEKPKDTRMGRGKGSVSKFVHIAKSGTPLFAFHRAQLLASKKILRSINLKVKIKSSIIYLKK